MPTAGGDLNRAPQPMIVFFELKDELTEGGSAVAYLLVWDHGAYRKTPIDGDGNDIGSPYEITVYDHTGKSGRAEDLEAEQEEDQRGARGVALFMPDSKRWYVLDIECPE